MWGVYGCGHLLREMCCKFYWKFGIVNLLLVNWSSNEFFIDDVLLVLEEKERGGEREGHVIS